MNAQWTRENPPTTLIYFYKLLAACLLHQLTHPQVFPSAYTPRTKHMLLSLFLRLTFSTIHLAVDTYTHGITDHLAW